MCKFLSYLVPEGPPYYANAPAKAVTMCETHNWMMMEGPTGVGALCPLGRVEKAVEEGLAKLAAHTPT
jgi:hypothetical protein